jgi:hypothetical protein
VVIFVCFLVSYATLTAVRLWLQGRIAGSGWDSYAKALAVRLGDQVPGHVLHFTEVVQKLWLARFQLASGGYDRATLEMFLGLWAWIFTFGLLLVAWQWRGRAALLVFADVVIVGWASLGVLAWYRLFLEHTFIHVLFIVRIAALPAGYGFVSAILLMVFLGRNWTRSAVAATIGAALISLSAAAYLLEGSQAIVTAARFAAQPATDSVSCASLGLRSDGKQDGLVELRLRSRQVSPPLALLGFAPRSSSPLFLRLERADPPGWWHTATEVYILGVSRNPRSALLNRADGSVQLPAGLVTHLWLHFCRDGHDTPGSTYSVRVGDTSLPVTVKP